KTTPGLRALEKWAVTLGGGSNHRFGLADGILIKDNHLALAGGDVARACRLARERATHGLKIEVEVQSLEAVQAARDGSADILLHDEVVSTNRVLVDLAHQGAPDGTVVVAESQTAGRGRLGRTWLSPRGLNLYVSILLARTLPPETVTWTPMLAALAVFRAIR